MKLPFTQKTLVDWGGAQVLKDAQTMVEKGMVLEAEYEPPLIRGAVLWSNKPLNTSLKILPDGSAESLCPCYANKERGVICAHVISLALTLVKRAADPQREQKYQEELRKASRVAALKDSDFIRRVPEGSAGAVPGSIRVTLARDWREGCRQDKVPVRFEAAYKGAAVPLDKVPRTLPLALSKQDEALLYVLEDICEGPARGRVELRRSDFINLVNLWAGREFAVEDGPAVAVNDTRMATYLRMDLDRENGELILIAHTELPFLKAGDFPFYVVWQRVGCVYGAGHFWPLETVVPTPYHSIYDEPVVVKRPDVLRFLQMELPTLSKCIRVESDLSLDLFTVEPARPSFRLLVRGSPASLSAVLFARYNGVELVAGKPDARSAFALPDPNDLLRYTVRNPDAEARGLELLAEAGFRGETGERLSSLVGNREVLNFLGGRLPALRRRGWQVDLEGKVSPYLDSLPFANPVVHVADKTGGWFDVAFDFEDAQGASLSPAEIQQALLKGECFVKQGDRTLLIDADAVASMRSVFEDCATGEGAEPGHFRMSDVYAGFVKSSLDALDGIDVEDTPDWRARAAQHNRTDRIEPVEIRPPLGDLLRPYQKDGVYWLRFLEQHGFCGLLADEMGLGKTIETLAWLEMKRADPQSAGKPALIVCPTSIVQNWAEEAAKFAPALNVLTLTGAERHEKWDRVPGSGVVITSYALLRRDLDRYLQHEFSAAILDEAQHIKNRSTQNAQAAKQIKARHRLVLTGTPLENSVSDLWSIMDFLMPGYLGSHDLFRRTYEMPITHGAQEGESAQVKLKRKLHPFLLRRLKTDVAKDLPPKIQKVATCLLTPDQRLVYNEVLKSSQRRLADMVKKNGFGKCRMEILAVLMRLRQVCCHLDLLKLPDLKAEQPSAKMDLFFELLDEALDSGHRILVFSQFVSMLTILRSELERRELKYCYLDGATKERMPVVHTFNAQREIPLFLISLKAGGTGLNLTGADMVIHFDPWWNPAVEDQATDRAYRIGQKRTVYSVKLITKDTVEEKVLAMQKKKKAVFDATLETDERIVETLTWEDVQDLLEL